MVAVKIKPFIFIKPPKKCILMMNFFRVIIVEEKNICMYVYYVCVYYLLNKHDSSAVAYSCTSTFVL